MGSKTPGAQATPSEGDGPQVRLSYAPCSGKLLSPLRADGRDRGRPSNVCFVGDGGKG